MKEKKTKEGGDLTEEKIYKKIDISVLEKKIFIFHLRQILIHFILH